MVQLYGRKYIWQAWVQYAHYIVMQSSLTRTLYCKISVKSDS